MTPVVARFALGVKEMRPSLYAVYSSDNGIDEPYFPESTLEAHQINVIIFDSKYRERFHWAQT